MRAVVLVGGEGTRLRPLTETIPKPLIALMDRRFLDGVLDHLARHGVDEAVMSSPYLEETFRPFIESRTGGPRITWITEERPLGTGGAIVRAIAHLPADEPVFALNGDILTDLDLTAMLAFHRERRAVATIALTHVQDARPFGLVPTSGDGRVLEFREKPTEPIPGEVNAGTYVVEPSQLAGWRAGDTISIEREIFPALIADGRPVYGFLSHAYWMDLGTPEKYLQAHFDLLAGAVEGERYRSPFVSASARVDPAARLGPRVVVGARAQVGPGAQVDDSVLQPDCVVEAGATVIGSIVGPGARVGANATLRRGVLGENAAVPPRASMDDARVSANTVAEAAAMSPRRALAAWAIAAAMTVSGFAAGPAAASKGFTFYGSGFGHGVGMSQWGAYGLARQGWNYKKILTHYYSHTRVRKAKHEPRTIRVGLSQGDHEYRVEAQGGPVKIVVDNPKHGTVVGSVPGGKRWRIKSAGSNFNVLNSKGKRVGGKSWGGPNANLYLVYGHGGSKVHVPEAGNTYNRGTLELNLYSCGGSCAMRLILDVPLEQYLYGVAEVSNSWPKDALRAQAVAARSYAIAKIAIYGQHGGSCNCGITAGLDQAYAGWDKEGSAGGNHWVSAVRTTSRQAVTYHGKAIQAFYSASSGGFTENNENVWGGTPLPYLRGVCDPGDYVKQNPSRTWRARFSRRQVTGDLRPYTGSVGTVRSFGSYKRGVSGRIVSVRVRGTHGSHNVSGTELRAALGLRDDRVWINADREVVGSIRTQYDRLNCAPGLPVSKDVKIAGGKGSKQDFKIGSIYRNEHANVTVWLRGMLLATYQDHGGPKGKLGLPTSGVRKHGKKFSVVFQHGSIVCSKSGCKVS